MGQVLLALAVICLFAVGFLAVAAYTAISRDKKPISYFADFPIREGEL
jgi:hypothetical protein